MNKDTFKAGSRSAVNIAVGDGVATQVNHIGSSSNVSETVSVTTAGDIPIIPDKFRKNIEVDGKHYVYGVLYQNRYNQVPLIVITDDDDQQVIADIKLPSMRLQVSDSLKVTEVRLELTIDHIIALIRRKEHEIQEGVICYR